MLTNRRQFIRLAGGSVLGWDHLPGGMQGRAIPKKTDDIRKVLEGRYGQ